MSNKLFLKVFKLAGMTSCGLGLFLVLMWGFNEEMSRASLAVGIVLLVAPAIVGAFLAIDNLWPLIDSINEENGYGEGE